jgi:hypothetical protein
VVQRYTPWQLRISARLIFTLIAIVLLVAFLVVAFVNSASTRGFFPKLKAASDANGFSPANFLYSFLPAFLGMLPLLFWQPIDNAHRRLTPFTNMTRNPAGAPAHLSLLLDYPFQPPVLATLRALANRDWAVAVTSVTSLLALPIPVLAGGVFWAQWYPATSTVRVAAHPAGLVALSVFLALYAGAYVALLALSRPTALPHPACSLAEMLSWLYMSPLLVDRAFAAPRDRADMIWRLMEPAPAGRRGKPAVAEEKTTATPPPPLPSHPSLRLVAQRGDDAASAAVDHDHDDINDDDEPQHSRLPPHLADGQARRDAEDDAPLSPQLPPPINATAPLPVAGPAENLERGGAREDDDRARFVFGVYIGRDGREHLGIDRAREGVGAWV